MWEPQLRALLSRARLDAALVRARVARVVIEPLERRRVPVPQAARSDATLPLPAHRLNMRQDARTRLVPLGQSQRAATAGLLADKARARNEGGEE